MNNQLDRNKVNSKVKLEHTVTLVASDLDGTLLNDRKQVSKENREAIQRLKQHGILFGISSGRPVETIVNMVEQWGLSNDIGFISGMNGGAIYDYRQQKKEDYYLLDGEIVIDIIHFFSKLDVIFQVLIGADRYVNKSTEETRAHAKLYGENEILVDLEEFLKGKKVNKLIIYFDPKIQDFILERAYEYKNDACVGFFTASNLFEYVDPHINKGFGMEKLADHFGTKVDYIVAFGDDSNDKEMLQKVGMGVAMRNAREEVKEIADFVSPYTNEQNAIAHFIDDYILLKKEK